MASVLLSVPGVSESSVPKISSKLLPELPVLLLPDAELSSGVLFSSVPVDETEFSAVDCVSSFRGVLQAARVVKRKADIRTDNVFFIALTSVAVLFSFVDRIITLVFGKKKETMWNLCGIISFFINFCSRYGRKKPCDETGEDRRLLTRHRPYSSVGVLLGLLL